MNRFASTILNALAAFSLVFGLAIGAQAQKRSDRQIRDAVRSLSSDVDNFEAALGYQMQSSSADTILLAAVSNNAQRLQSAVHTFEQNYYQHRENRDDISGIIDAAKQVDGFMQQNPQNRDVQSAWQGVHRQIDRLAANYSISPQWSGQNTADLPVDNNVGNNDPGYSNNNDPGYSDNNAPGVVQKVQKGALNPGLAGTYDLDASRSESTDDILNNSGLGTDQQEDLKDKLEAPAQIAIDIRGNRITLSTSNASPMVLTADGRDKVEHPAPGKTVRLRATLTGDTLTVSRRDGESDYTIKLTSVSGGREMKVTRRITTDYLNQTVFLESVYNKTDSVARLGTTGGGVSPSNSGSTNDDDVSSANNGTTTDNDPNGGYSDNDQGSTPSYGGAPRTVNAKPGNYVVPDRSTITGRLENVINTKVSQNNDRFRITVQSPMELRGAVIEGYISGVGRSGKISGQANVTLNFEKITLRSGETYDFAGVLQSITDQYGKTVNVDNEGTIRGDSQTRETAKRGAIGGGIGAVIGAIVGGGKGAAIGAVIGGGGGAGSVVVQGREDIILFPGSTVTIQATSPIQRQDR